MSALRQRLSSKNEDKLCSLGPDRCLMVSRSTQQTTIDNSSVEKMKETQIYCGGNNETWICHLALSLSLLASIARKRGMIQTDCAAVCVMSSRGNPSLFVLLVTWQTLISCAHARYLRHLELFRSTASDGNWQWLDKDQAPIDSG